MISVLCSPTIFFMSNQRDFIFGRVARGSIDPDNEGIEWISLRSINQRARVGRGARQNRRPTTEEQNERQSAATACVALSSVSPTPDMSMRLLLEARGLLQSLAHPWTPCRYLAEECTWKFSSFPANLQIGIRNDHGLANASEFATNMGDPPRFC